MIGCIIDTTDRKRKVYILHSSNALPLIKSSLVKVTARCNLNCDYCYVFNHADQSWKNLPARMSVEVVESFANKLSDYIKENHLEEFLCIFHGGEPLLLGAETIVMYKKIIENYVHLTVSKDIKLYFSMQTNGVLLKEKDAGVFESENIGISMSLDGPKGVQDLHRLTQTGKSSYEKAKRGLDILKKHPTIFEGVISVIDPRTNPAELLNFFAEINPPSCDFLLPDSNYVKNPFYKDVDNSCYKEWLKNCFDTWIEEYPHLRLRFFDNLCESILTGKSNTEAFGFGDVSLISIETDGTYHDTDIFKTTAENFSNLGLNVKDHSFKEATRSPKIQNHRRLLSKEGLSHTCQNCDVVDVCGGGCVQHRYNPGSGFQNPSIYCEELYFIIKHATSKLEKIINEQDIISSPPEKRRKEQHLSFSDMAQFNASSTDSLLFRKIYNYWAQNQLSDMYGVMDWVVETYPSYDEVIKKIKSLSMDQKTILATYPSVVLWKTLAKREKDGQRTYDIDLKKTILFNPEDLYSFHDIALREKNIHLHSKNYYLRCLFDSSIVFESDDDIIKRSRELVLKSLELIKGYSPALFSEISLISPSIQFICDPNAHPDKLVSFSDNQVPGCLYIEVRQGDLFASVEDVADSIIHEHRHQKLSLLESYTDVVLNNHPYVKSPWRETPRPVSGVFHGLFVFYELTRFWEWIENTYPLRNKTISSSNIFRNLEMMEESISTLKGCSLGEAGRHLLNVFENYKNSLKSDIMIGEIKCAKFI